MKALLLKEYKQLEVTDVPAPKIADDEVLVRVRACGICGAPLLLPMAAEILHDDGDVRHHMIIPLARIPCVNPDCSEFRPTTE